MSFTMNELDCRVAVAPMMPRAGNRAVRRATKETAAGRTYLDLQCQARRTGRRTDELIQLYALECFLDRLAHSDSPAQRRDPVSAPGRVHAFLTALAFSSKLGHDIQSWTSDVVKRANRARV